MTTEEHTHRQNYNMKRNTVLSMGNKIGIKILRKKVKSSKFRAGTKTVVKGNRNNCDILGSSDIRRYFGMTHNSSRIVDNLHNEWKEVVEKDEDGFEIVNYPTQIDRGSSLFSLNMFDDLQDFSQDELRDISKTNWGIYKEDLG